MGAGVQMYVYIYIYIQHQAAGQCSELGKKSKVAWLNDLVSSAAI